MPDPFPSGVYSLFRSLLLLLKRFRSVPLMGGPQGPSVSRSPGTAPQKRAGLAHGPLHPALSAPQSFLVLMSLQGCCGEKGFCFGLLLRGFALRTELYGFLSPSSFGPCFAFLFWFFLGPLSGWGVHRPDDLFLSTTGGRLTGEEGTDCTDLRVLGSLCSVWCVRLDWGGCGPHDDTVSTSSRCSGRNLLPGPPCNKAWLPQTICRPSSSVSSWPSGVFLSFFWVGGASPCRVFLSPLARVAFFSPGWVGSPCRVFPVFSPWFLGGVGARFFSFLLLPLASCIFSLSCN